MLHLPALLVRSFKKQLISHHLHPSVAQLVAFWCFALVEPFRSTERRCESLSSGHLLPPPPPPQYKAQQQRHVPSQGLVPGGSGQQRARSVVIGIDISLALCECSVHTRGVQGRPRPVWWLRVGKGGSSACAVCAACAARVGSGWDWRLAKPKRWGWLGTAGPPGRPRVSKYIPFGVAMSMRTSVH